MRGHFAYPRVDDLNIVLKINERCNLKCSYCYFFFAGDESWRDHPVSIPLETGRDVAVYVQKIAVAHQLKQVDVIMHGGEPLLVHKKRFRELCQTFRDHETGFQFRFSVQTNAVLVDEAWVDLFAEFDVGVGVSLDGHKAVNDLHRLDAHGHSSYNETVAGLCQLQKAAEQGRIRFPGLICVVNPQASGKEVYRHLVDDLGVRSISLRMPIYNHDTVPDRATIDGVNRFMIDALGEWLKDDNPSIKVRQFLRPFYAMLRNDCAEDTAEFGEDYRNIVCVSSNGDIGPDDGVRTCAPRFAEIGLNAKNSSFAELESTGVWQEMRDASANVPPGCQGCQWWRACKGGPLATRYASKNDAGKNGFDNPSIYCEGLKQMHAMIADALMRSGVSVDNIAKRLQVAQG